MSFPPQTPPKTLNEQNQQEKKKAQRPTDRMKFVFDWDAKEDTSKDLNPLYNSLHGALFGGLS